MSIYSVLSSTVLKEAFKWHAVSVFAFENFFFLEKIDTTWRALFSGTAPRRNTAIRACADELVRTFIGMNAPWEISLSAPVRNKLSQTVMDMKAEDMTAELFDAAYTSVLRDVSRSLTQFQTTPLFASITDPANHQALQEIFASQKSQV